MTVRKMWLKLIFFVLLTNTIVCASLSGIIAAQNQPPNLIVSSYKIANYVEKPPSLPDVQAGDEQLKIILEVVFGITGAISVLMITIGGFNYIISSGDPQKTAKAKDTILYSVIGLVISILAFSIFSFVMGRL